jgi:outer membrane protein assembly factor BamB
MSINPSVEPAPRKPLLLWLGVVAVVLWLLRFVIPVVAPPAIIAGMLGSLVGALAVIVWWAFFSRGPRVERWGGVLLMIAAMAVTSRLIDRSIATGMMGFMFAGYALPVLAIAFSLWAIFSRRLADGPRRASMVATILLACGGWTLLRTNGITGEATSEFAWRWSKTHEERLVAQPAARLPVVASLPTVPVAAPISEERLPVRPAPVQPAALPPTPVKAAAVAAVVTNKTGATWPGFRGPGRDSIIPGIQIATDWSASPPVELWRRPVGPGWGSFAVTGDLFYTQEQRGDDEIVACYHAATGKPVWAHRDAARFWESNAGAGPRATPTLHDGHVYAFGATGIVNALDAATGALLWSRNAASDTATKVPGWGFSSSPLVIGDMVIVAASGKLVAYDAATGTPRWYGPAAGGSYSSPHRLTLAGVEQIVLMSSLGATGISPADGTQLWKYSWPSDTRIMQPALTAEGDLLMSGGDAMGGVGIRRIAVAHGAGGWTTEERWTSPGLKPNFNDFVVYEGHVFGFDGGILACLDIKDGRRTWKGGRYGHGQLVLLRDQGLLLVLSEEGELALVKAATDQFTELAKFPAIEGKTWNHPVLVADRLLVRNGDEMAAFRLSLAPR